VPIPMREVLHRGREFFMGQSDVHEAAERICRTLGEMNIPYALCGGLAVGRYGPQRMTEDVDILLTDEGLRLFKQRWLGVGWVERFQGAKGMRDAHSNVKVDVLITGDIPGDGKTSPFGFPSPEAAAETDEDGIRVMKLRDLIELKTASGMTAPHRPRDLDDVMRLIEANNLGKGYALRLHPYVRAKYEELWSYAQASREDENDL
jgi:hypothetical protein